MAVLTLGLPEACRNSSQLYMAVSGLLLDNSTFRLGCSVLEESWRLGAAFTDYGPLKRDGDGDVEELFEKT